MRRIFLVCFASSILTACNSSSLSEGKKSTTSSESKEDQDQHQGEDELDPVAFTPVPIGGASLLCLRASASEARCESLSAAGARVDLNPVKAYVISSSDLDWKESSWQRLSVGYYSITLAAGTTESFAIAMTDANAQFVADWVVSSQDPIALKLGDHSFEGVKVPAGETFFHRTSAESPSWKVTKSAGNLCHAAYFEVLTFSNSVRGVPSEGSNWIELNSGCLGEGEFLQKGANVIVGQSLNLTPGHAYQIVFDYRKRADGNFQRFLARFEGAALAEITTATETWATYRAIVSPKTANALLEFEGAGDQVNTGIGAQLDNVRVYHLGEAKD